MPIAGSLALHGTVRADPTVARATFSGWLVTGDPDPPTLTGSVSRDHVGSFDAETVVIGVRVELGGVDVTADLVGEVVVDDGVDSPLNEATFTLQGAQYAPAANVEVWTQTPVRVWFRQGPPGAVREVLELDGVLEPGAASSKADGVSLRAVDRGLIANRNGVCLTVPPHAGLSRGEISSSLAQAAGFAAVDVPPGATYRKPLEATGGNLFEILNHFGEPEGWHWRTTTDGTLECYRPEVAPEPFGVDAVWTTDDMLEPPNVEAPSEVASRWVVRGARAITSNEVGITTESRTTNVRDTFALPVAVQRQDNSGNVTPTGLVATVGERVVTTIQTEETRQGDRLLRRTTIEYGWHNPATGKWGTDGPAGLGNGPVGAAGYYFLDAYISAEGAFVAWPIARFVEVRRRQQDYLYDTAGNLIGIRVTTHGWGRTRRAVRAAASPTVDVAGTAIGDDDMSYAHVGGQTEHYGVISVETGTYVYDPSTGALARETLETQEVFSPRATVDPLQGFWVLADGSGQEVDQARLQLAVRRQRQNLVDVSGRLAGHLEREFGYAVHAAEDGIYDFGDLQSNQTLARFEQTRSEGREIQITSPDAYTEITYEGNRRTETLRLGAPPLPRYEASAWTQLQHEPFEVAIDDELLEKWFGPSSQVISHDHLQSLAEAHALILRKLRRALSHKISVTRPETGIELGATVLVVDPQQGLGHRAVIVGRSRRRNVLTGEATAVYRLEAPLV